MIGLLCECSFVTLCLDALYPRTLSLLLLMTLHFYIHFASNLTI